MEVIMKPTLSVPKKRKKKAKSATDPKYLKGFLPNESIITPYIIPEKIKTKQPKAPAKKVKKVELVVDHAAKYPILKNETLVQRFLNVPMTNNQKGRLRQVIKESLQGSSNTIMPEMVHSKIQAILKSSTNLTDAQLRRVRILYNLLKSALNGEKIVDDIIPKPPTTADNLAREIEKQKKKKTDKNAGDSAKIDKDAPLTKEQKDKKNNQNNQLAKKKGPKRYVVFLGNLPLDIDKQKIVNHFSEMNEHIKDIRIPKPKEGQKSAIAYVELSNEPSYEFALSKHHSMLGKKRISVLYTTQRNSRISKADAKSKSAKLIALQKSGKLVGSVPMAKKRSQRRLKLKQARAKAEA